MSHTITLCCGCLVYVACDPSSGVAHTRVLERRDPRCGVRTHEVGVKLAVWELLPDPQRTAASFESTRSPGSSTTARFDV
jgi:hypothetical protein